MMIDGGEDYEPQTLEHTNHESHFSWHHEHTWTVCGGVVIALIGAFAAWLKWRRK